MQLPDERPRMEPPRIVLYSVEGWGKTSAGAFSPDPVMCMAAGETGYDTLYSAPSGGRVPRVPKVLFDSWAGFMAFINELIKDSQGRKTLVIDTLEGFEELCHQYTAEIYFNGDRSKKGGFLSYQDGFNMATQEWMKMLIKLDRLRAKQRCMILVLGHAQEKNFSNPTGQDFTRYSSSLHKSTWQVTRRWSDAVLFGIQEIFTVKESKKKTKGIGGETRMLYTEFRGPWDAKNRYGMAPEIEIPDDHTQVWNTIWKAITGDGK